MVRGERRRIVRAREEFVTQCTNVECDSEENINGEIPRTWYVLEWMPVSGVSSKEYEYFCSWKCVAEWARRMHSAAS